jgi:hypothetical protein
MCSAKGSPGVTVSALAMTLAWPGPVLLAECDPAGGDLAAGFLRETGMEGRGLAPLGASLRRGRLAEDLWSQLVDLAPGERTSLTRLVLPGFSEPGQARAWTDADAPGGPTGWHQLAALFTRLSSSQGRSGPVGETGGGWRGEVIADCGRLAAPDQAVPVLAAADLVVLVARPVLPSVRAAAAGLADLSRQGIGPVGLLMVGDGDYAPAECARQLGVRLIAALPADPGTARVLSRGGRSYRGRLLRAAAHAGSALAGTTQQPGTTSGQAEGEPPDRTSSPGPVLTERPGSGPLAGHGTRPGEISSVR